MKIISTHSPFLSFLLPPFPYSQCETKSCRKKRRFFLLCKVNIIAMGEREREEDGEVKRDIKSL
jgi:hypothetical protein